jgi:RNA polymerase sigma factor (sigma-70 family)
VGRGMSGVVEAPSIVAEPVANGHGPTVLPDCPSRPPAYGRDADDSRLVAALRRGDDRAFEALYSRYCRRIHAYVMGMVKDHGRAEDITQEVFVSALRRMRETERPIAFKPWIYEIAKNACIDQFRRSRRAEEVSLQADDGLAPSDYGKLIGSGQSPDAAVAAKQDLDHLCGAFGGLSDTHHQILVLRELEGLSYREIGERMGMSRPAVESTLFRARRRLTEEYDDLVTGARCRRIQQLIATAAETRLGTREARRLSRHIAHCQPCRREATAAGLDAAILTHVPVHRRAAAKVAALLPFPIFGRGRGDAGTASIASGSDGGGGWTTHLPMLSEQLSGGWGKLAAVAAVLVAGVGATEVGTRVVGGGASAAPDRGADRAAPAKTEKAATARRTASKIEGVRAKERTDRGSRTRRDAERRRRPGTTAGARGGASAPRRASGGGSGVIGAATPVTEAAGGGSSGAPAATVDRTVKGTSGGSGQQLPSVTVPGTTTDPVETVQQTADQVVPPPVEETTAPVTDAVGDAADTVEQTVDDAGGTVEDTVDGAGVPLP